MSKKLILFTLAVILTAGAAWYFKNNQAPLSTRVLTEKSGELTLTLSKDDGRGITGMSLRNGDTGKLVLIGKNTTGKKIPVSIETEDIDNIYFHQFNPGSQTADEFLFHARKLGNYEYRFTINDGEKTLMKTVQFIIRPGLNLRTDLHAANTPACDFPDTDSELVRKFCQQGIINGYPDGTFRPDSTINRAEMMKIAYGLFGTQQEIEAMELNLKKNNIFSFADVEPSHWAAPYIAIAKKLGKIQGYADGSFIPFQEVKRAEAWKMMIEAAIYLDVILQAAFDLDQSSANDAWYSPYEGFGKMIGMNIPGENEIPGWQLMAAPINRLEVVEFMSKIIDFIPTETVVSRFDRKSF